MKETNERDYRGFVDGWLDAGEPEKALEECKEGIAHFPDSYWLHNLAAVACDYLRRYDEAITWLTKAIELEPDAVSAYKYRAVMYQKAGEAAAVADYTRAIELDPKPYLYFYRATIYERQNDIKRARADLHVVIAGDDARYAEMAANMLETLKGRVSI